MRVSKKRTSVSKSKKHIRKNSWKKRILVSVESFFLTKIPLYS
uniref:Ribosomal protein L32 n=1 Tax=Passiflora misera TaxID=159432 RepID=A0A4Y5QFZ3_PASMS|nr:ribosomal protein L32 [Passiflora misera]QCX30466.1 ribosomal protein L32 [Passiflora misera]